MSLSFIAFWCAIGLIIYLTLRSVGLPTRLSLPIILLAIMFWPIMLLILVGTFFIIAFRDNQNDKR